MAPEPTSPDPTVDVGPAALDVSVVVPVWNERASLRRLHESIARALDGAGLSWEAILVDDGSTDGSREEIASIHAADPRVRVVWLKRNCGQHAAISAGLERARGGVVVTMDADLQNDPADIPALVGKLAEGHDLVSGWRRDRAERALRRRLPSAIVNWAVGRATGIAVRDANCAMKAMTATLAREASAQGERRRYLAALLLTLARSHAEVPVRDHERAHGGSKYSLARAIGLALDFAVTFSTRPFRLLGFAGLALGSAGIVAGGLYALARLTFLEHGMPRFILFVLMLLFGGTQFVILGFLGEYVIRIHSMLLGKPLFEIERDSG